MSLSAFGSVDGLNPIALRISLAERISFLVNLSAIWARSLAGTRANGFRRKMTD